MMLPFRSFNSAAVAISNVADAAARARLQWMTGKPRMKKTQK